MRYVQWLAVLWLLVSLFGVGGCTLGTQGKWMIVAEGKIGLDNDESKNAAKSSITLSLDSLLKWFFPPEAKTPETNP